MEVIRSSSSQTIDRRSELRGSIVKPLGRWRSQIDRAMQRRQESQPRLRPKRRTPAIAHREPDLRRDEIHLAIALIRARRVRGDANRQQAQQSPQAACDHPARCDDTHDGRRYTVPEPTSSSPRKAAIIVPRVCCVIGCPIDAHRCEVTAHDAHPLRASAGHPRRARFALCRALPDSGGRVLGWAGRSSSACRRRPSARRSRSRRP